MVDYAKDNKGKKRNQCNSSKIYKSLLAASYSPEVTNTHYDLEPDFVREHSFNDIKRRPKTRYRTNREKRREPEIDK